MAPPVFTAKFMKGSEREALRRHQPFTPPRPARAALPLLSTASTELRDAPSHCPGTRDPFCTYSRGWTHVGAYEQHLACLMFCWTASVCTKCELIADVCRLRRSTSTRLTPAPGAQAAAGPRRSACVRNPKRHSRCALTCPSPLTVREPTAATTTGLLRAEAVTSWCPWLEHFRLGIMGQAGSGEVTAMGGPAESA